LLVSVAVLSLLWFGVLGVLVVGRTNLAQILWPSWTMLTTGWHSTPAGITIAIISVATNCVLYAGIAVALHALFKWIRLLSARSS
jgi:hypothetical protein